jgi:REP element-mobilizing transposase RayT
MTHGYQIRSQDGLHYLTLQIVHWADVFSRKIYRDIVVESFKFCQQNKGLEIYAYVIMTNHIHLLIRSTKADLSNVVRDLKRHTSKKIIEAIEQGEESRREWLLMIFRYAARKHSRNNEYQVWTHENHAEEIFSNKFIEQKIIYIHNNPVRAGLAEKPEEYLYSSARNYADMESIIEVCKATFRCKTVR